MLWGLACLDSEATLLWRILFELLSLKWQCLLLTSMFRWLLLMYLY